ncbi:MAG: DUF4179 domain-containing protein [Chloroflexota bacterium]|nr:DUF4179 domain-containing protein [Chloroflexota bacterium]
MTPERRLRDTYPDLLADDADPALLRLVADLDAVSAATEPPSALGPLITHALCERAAIRRPEAVPALRFLPARWQTIRGRAQVADPRSRAGRRAWGAFVTGANAVATIALVVILVAALALVLGRLPKGGAGAGPTQPVDRATLDAPPPPAPRSSCRGAATNTEALLACVYGLADDGTRRVEAAGLVQRVNLSQTIDGITVTVWGAYADANRILIGYTVERPTGITAEQRVEGGYLQLTDSAGQTFLNSNGGSGYKDEAAAISGGIGSFDASVLPFGTKEETFTLTMPRISIVRPLDQPPASPAPQREQSGGAPSVHTAPRDRDVAVDRVAGPWIFTLTLPVLPGRVAEVGRTVTVNGVPVRLERVVVTPAETRPVLQFPAFANIREEEWRLSAHLTVADSVSGRGEARGNGRLLRDGLGTYFTVFADDLYDRQGEWTLTIDELRDLGPVVASPATRQPEVRTVGPWTFRFVVP